MQFDQHPDHEDSFARRAREKASANRTLAAAVANTGGVAAKRPKGDARPIAPVPVPEKRQAVLSAFPKVAMVAPTFLQVEPAYQRDLSAKSMRLIRSIVADWDWAKFKPPICAQTPDGYFIIDGQHTAIAAASHPEIKKIPILIVDAAQLERRAESFVAHNRNRLVMTPAQIFYGEAAAGKKDAKRALAIMARAGCSIPRAPVPKHSAKPGQINAVGEVCDIMRIDGADVLERVLRIAALSKIVPVSKTVLRSLRMILTDEAHERLASKIDEKIAAALGSIPQFELKAQQLAAETEQSRFSAAVSLIAQAAA